MLQQQFHYVSEVCFLHEGETTRSEIERTANTKGQTATDERVGYALGAWHKVPLGFK